MFDDFEKPIYPEFYPPPRPSDEPQPKPPLPEISIQLRLWRGKRGYRVVCPLLSEAFGYDVSPSALARIENGHVNAPQLVADIEAYLKTQ